MLNRLRRLVVFACAFTAPASAHAVTIFSQTPAHSASFASDLDFNEGVRQADDFTLATEGSVESVRWRGVYLFGDPVFPLKFDLTVFGDAGGVPNNADVLVSTSVTFPTAADVELVGPTGGDDLYEFSADLPATALDATTRYWFSPLADTRDTSSTNWFWSTGNSGDPMARQNNVPAGDPWTSDTNGPFYFELDGTIVPEPATGLVVLVAAAPLLARPRHRGHPQTATSRIGNDG